MYTEDRCNHRPDYEQLYNDLMNRVCSLESDLYHSISRMNEQEAWINEIRYTVIDSEERSRSDFARYMEDVCISLRDLFKLHFENDNFDITEDEFNRIIGW